MEKRKRVRNKKIMDEFQNTINQINKEYNTLSKINLLKRKQIFSRTSNRPEYFDKCIKVLEQNYKNYEVFACYDKKNH